MKVRLSLTLDKELVAFIDHEPGTTRSGKIESVLRRYREVQRDLLLREEAAGDSAVLEDGFFDAIFRHLANLA